MKKLNWKELLIKVVMVAIGYIAATIGIEIPY